MVLVTAGARLGSEITGDWAHDMIGLLSQRPNVVWVLVGNQGAVPPALAEMPPAQLRLVPHQKDLRSLLRCCDIYVNPRRLGGGFSVADAMAEGLPTLAFADFDGGNKLGDHAVEDHRSYFRKLEDFIDDLDLRKQDGAALRALFAKTLDLDQSGPSLLSACELTIARFHERTGVSPRSVVTTPAPRTF